MSGVRVLVGTRKGAFVLTVRRQARGWDVSGPHFARLGDLPPQGLARRPEPALRLAVQRLVRADHAALGRRRQDLGAGRQRVRLRRRARHAPVVRRHAAPVGVQARLAPRAVAGPIPTPSTPASRTPRSSARPTAARRGTSCPACAATARARTGSRAPAACACTRSCSIPSEPERIVHRHLRRRRLPHRRRRRRPGSRSTAGCSSRLHPRPDGRGRPLRAPHRDAPVAARRALHAEALGRDAQRRRAANPGTRSAATCRPTSASRSTSTPTSPRRSTSCRSRATPSTTRPTASCACTAAAPAATSGRR